MEPDQDQVARVIPSLPLWVLTRALRNRREGRLRSVLNLWFSNCLVSIRLSVGPPVYNHFPFSYEKKTRRLKKPDQRVTSFSFSRVRRLDSAVWAALHFTAPKLRQLLVSSAPPAAPIIPEAELWARGLERSRRDRGEEATQGRASDSAPAPALRREALVPGHPGCRGPQTKRAILPGLHRAWPQ